MRKGEKEAAAGGGRGSWCGGVVSAVEESPPSRLYGRRGGRGASDQDNTFSGGLVVANL